MKWKRNRESIIIYNNSTQQCPTLYKKLYHNTLENKKSVKKICFYLKKSIIFTIYKNTKIYHNEK